MVTSTFSSLLAPKQGWKEVYTLRFLEGRPTREVAQMLGISADAVLEIQNRVIAWLAQNSPLFTAASRDEGQKLAEMLARQQLEHCYGEAMRAWDRSQQDEVTIRQEGILAKTTRTTRSSYGQIKYLALAGKISEAMVKVPVRQLPGWADELALPGAVEVPQDLYEEEHDVHARQDASDYGSESENRAKWALFETLMELANQEEQDEELDEEDDAEIPPEEDCSPAEPMPRDFVDVFARPSGASAACTKQWLEGAESLAAVSEQNGRIFETVQREQIGIGEGRPLSRKQRRARQRLLEKAKRRRAG